MSLARPVLMRLSIGISLLQVWTRSHMRPYISEGLFE
jgi:hypothetical protein